MIKIETGSALVAALLAPQFFVSTGLAASEEAGPRAGAIRIVQESTFRRLENVRVPMRDGVTLATDVWLPMQDGKYPLVLMRTPYGRLLRAQSAEYWTSRGYAFAVQDIRGEGESGGVETFDYHYQEIADGYDSIEWLAGQPWSNGRVGTTGASYSGISQWMALKAAPPHLACAFPVAAPGSHFDNYAPYIGGAWSQTFAMNWAYGRTPQHMGRGEAPADPKKLLEAYRNRPLITMDEAAFGFQVPLARAWLEHPTIDEYWAREWFTETDYQSIRVSVLAVTGWFDCGGCLAGTVEYFTGLRQHSPLQRDHHILIGPWNHAETFASGGRPPRIGELDRPGSNVDIRDLNAAWFDYCLKGAADRFDFPVARLYLTGLNQWFDFSNYPPQESQERRLYLHSSGKANTLSGDGRLNWHEPRGIRPPARFVFDPKNPVPVASAHTEGDVPFGGDRREAERRDDVLVYSTEPLAESLVVVGRVTVVLHAATDARDTDWTAQLIDVHPDGRALKLGQYPAGIMRARFRRGFDREVLVTPNEPDRYEINVGDIGHAFLTGHRIRIEISSSAYPDFAPNQNTGNPIATDTQWQIANQTVFHDRLRPSHVVLPVLPMNGVKPSVIHKATPLGRNLSDD